MLWVARFCGNAQGKEDQLFSELEARYGTAKAPVRRRPRLPDLPRREPVGRADSRWILLTLAVETAGEYFSQENPVIREITQRVQAM